MRLTPFKIYAGSADSTEFNAYIIVHFLTVRNSKNMNYSQILSRKIESTSALAGREEGQKSLGMIVFGVGDQFRQDLRWDSVIGIFLAEVFSAMDTDIASFIYFQEIAAVE